MTVEWRQITDGSYFILGLVALFFFLLLLLSSVGVGNWIHYLVLLPGRRATHVKSKST